MTLWWKGLGALGLGTMALSLTFCDNGALGQEACRAIESKRCETLSGCAGFDLDAESEITACKLYYRDQCIFGLAADVAQEPDGPMLDRCLAALDAAAACKGGDGTLASCDGPPDLDASYDPEAGTDGNVDVTSATACQVLNYPSYLVDCAFLQAVPTADEEEAGSGGSDGSGGANGSGGAGGARGGG